MNTCALCGSSEDVRLCIVEYAHGSAGVLRPVCAKCGNGTGKDELKSETGYPMRDSEW